ncbi:dihydroneopterin aldolase [bacterium]|nr:MAG: dihydroneopterin aldolase [bacterium]
MAELDVIRIKNAVFYAYHGTEDDEQNLGGKFEVDVDLYCDVSVAAEKDALRKTVDYEKVYAVISEVVLARKYRLLEALGMTIGRTIIRDFYNVERVITKIRKPHPPVKGVVDYVEVEISQTR